jgi:parallel beta-helix repeat protein
MKRLLLIALSLTSFAFSVSATVINVPAQYRTIQAGINASANGDTVMVADGTYTGTGNKNIVIGGRNIVVMSQNGPDSCIIDCQHNGMGFIIHQGETPAMVVDGFTITNGQNGPDSINAGAIDIWTASPTIKNCILNGNWANWDGGGICCLFNSQAVIENSVINRNYSPHNGGGIGAGYGSDVTIRYCLITGNNASNSGDGIWLYDGTFADIINCTIVGNEPGFGTGICPYTSTIHLRNTIISYQATGVDFTNAYISTVNYCDFFGNTNHFLGTGPVNIGVIVMNNANGTPCDQYYNIFQNPLFVNPGAMVFNLLTGSPCINAGDPHILDPDGTISDIGAYYVTLTLGGNVTIDLIPINPPIVVPATGGPVNFTAFIQNDTSGGAVFDAWTMLTYPNGVVSGPQILRQNLFLAPSGNINRELSINIPLFAMAGEYTLHGYVGVYPDSVDDSSSFSFTKSARETEYSQRNEPVSEKCGIGIAISPNPFNIQATLSFMLPEAGNINIKAYDVTGREVATIYAGSSSAGWHEIKWEANNQNSGIYFIRIQTERYSKIIRTLLLK